VCVPHFVARQRLDQIFTAATTQHTQEYKNCKARFLCSPYRIRESRRLVLPRTLVIWSSLSASHSEQSSATYLVQLQCIWCKSWGYVSLGIHNVVFCVITPSSNVGSYKHRIFRWNILPPSWEFNSHTRFRSSEEHSHFTGVTLQKYLHYDLRDMFCLLGPSEQVPPEDRDRIQSRNVLL
jgi:hypothetical protein